MPPYKYSGENYNRIYAKVKCFNGLTHVICISRREEVEQRHLAIKQVKYSYTNN